MIDDSSDELGGYYMKLGQHYESAKEYGMAERFYMQGNSHKTAIEMYNKAGMWEEAHGLASQHMGADEVRYNFNLFNSSNSIFLQSEQS